MPKVKGFLENIRMASHALCLTKIPWALLVSYHALSLAWCSEKMICRRMSYAIKQSGCNIQNGNWQINQSQQEKLGRGMTSMNGVLGQDSTL